MFAQTFQPVASSPDIREAALFGAVVDGTAIVLGRLDGVLFALDGTCSDQGARLCEGDLDGPVLSCPLHNGAFDIRTGAPERLPVDAPIARYAVREENGIVLVAASAQDD